MTYLQIQPQVCLPGLLTPDKSCLTAAGASFFPSSLPPSLPSSPFFPASP